MTDIHMSWVGVRVVADPSYPLSSGVKTGPHQPALAAQHGKSVSPAELVVAGPTGRIVVQRRIRSTNGAGDDVINAGRGVEHDP